MSVLAAIRSATAARHKELEDQLDIVARLSRAAERGAILSRYHQLYASAEPALLTQLDGVAGLDYRERLKTPRLSQDLKAMGLARPDVVSEGLPMPAGVDRSWALGFAYVLEGATLGGRVIRKQLARLGVPAEETRFFEGYGEDTGRRWTTFCAVLERDCVNAPDQAVAGALAGFDYVREGLLGPAPVTETSVASAA